MGGFFLTALLTPPTLSYGCLCLRNLSPVSFRSTRTLPWLLDSPIGLCFIFLLAWYWQQSPAYVGSTKSTVSDVFLKCWCFLLITKYLMSYVVSVNFHDSCCQLIWQIFKQHDFLQCYSWTGLSDFRHLTKGGKAFWFSLLRPKRETGLINHSGLAVLPSVGLQWSKLHDVMWLFFCH